MARIRDRAATLEARIAAAESRVPDHGMPASVLDAYRRTADVLLCFCCEAEDIRGCLLQRGLSEDDAERYAGMAYDEARDELMAAPALDITF